MNMTRTFIAQDGSPAPGRGVRRVTCRACAVVLGGLVLAAVYTDVALGLDASAEPIGPLWMAPIAWTVLASLAGARVPSRRLVHLSGYEFPENNGDIDEWALRAGRYSWLRDMDDQLLQDDDHLR